jgi:hypothetical protein
MYTFFPAARQGPSTGVFFIVATSGGTSDSRFIAGKFSSNSLIDKGYISLI